jgi:3-hydroxyisobutyrate dehydrogenase-like beta-hydroxyacid dehydrogenase
MSFLGLTSMKAITLIGYGEVGRILAEELRKLDKHVCAYDLKLVDARSDALRSHASEHGVALADSHAQAVRGADLVISAVTAGQAVPVAHDVAPAIEKGAFFLDLNSASPGAKIEASLIVNHAGGRYVEGAVMTSVPPYRTKVPLILGGPDAADLEPLLRDLGFAPALGSAKLGVASATKMCRSVMVKGLEAMVIESFTAARHYGVEDAVLASLKETFPGIDWDKQGAYFFQRAIEHGRRRAEEVREVARTVREAGLEPWSASGTADRQAWIADLADEELFGARGADGFARSTDWRVEADRILEHVKGTKP